MENLGLNSLQDAFKGRRVFVTGHTGFKGSWLCQWLLMLGAEVKGYALPPETSPNHHDLLRLPMDSGFGDIRDRDKLMAAIRTFRPAFIFHLAAQPLVKRSYANPADTYSTNIMGLVNLLDAALACDDVQGVLNVTSDKCYENQGLTRGYVESDPMGGHDPYSASKGCAELVTASYRRSFFAEHDKLLASARAGNVVGGGDWSADRLVPDVMRAIASGTAIHVRRPQATRPWQHVLEPLHGYLLLAKKLLDGDTDYAAGWNFGTTLMRGNSVREVLACMHARWPAFDIVLAPEAATFHEADQLQLDGSKARELLNWSPLLDTQATFAWTMDWYSAFHADTTVLTHAQISEYCRLIAASRESLC